MICRECGARIDDDAVECKFCGAKYAEAEPVEEVVEPEPVIEEELVTDDEQDKINAILDENEAKRRAQMARLSDEKQAQLKEIEKRRKNKKRRQRRNRLLIILLILLCGVAVAAAVYYISPGYMGGVDDSVVLVTQNPTKTPEATEEPEETATPMPTIGVVEETQAPTEIVEDDETEAVVPVATSRPTATRKPVAVAQKPVATKKPVVQNTGISAALVLGGEVVKDNGVTYMSFEYNGKVCYAKVSDNTTSGFVSGKPMTISATKTGETYNGKSVYTISKITHYNGAYMLQNSGTALLTDDDLKGLTADQLRVARNEIYARHGRAFKDSTLQSYFNGCSWYKPNSNYNYSNENRNLNSTEKYNVNLIKKYEDALR